MYEDLPHPPVPPVAPRRRSAREMHGETVVDDYAWMRDPDDPALRDYLTSERAFYEIQRDKFSALARTLAAEATTRLPAGDEYSVAWPRGGFFYRTRTPHGADNEQLLRAPEQDTDEQVLLDENVLAAQTGFVEVGVREPSPDGALLAWSADTSGAETYRLCIRDLQTGEDLPEAIARSYPGVAWCAGSECVFYLVPDELHRPYQVWRHRVGTPASADTLVLEEPDQRFELTLSGSRSGDLAIITAESRDTTEVWLIPLDQPIRRANTRQVAPARRRVPGRSRARWHALPRDGCR